MKLSELIREYVDLKIEGEPKGSEWSSIESNYRRREEYRERLAELEEAIDAMRKTMQAEMTRIDESYCQISSGQLFTPKG